MSHPPRALFADISSNDRSFNANQYRSAGHKLIAIKVSEGTGYVNPKHAEWVAAAREMGITICHYHFARPANANPSGEAQHFFNALENHFHPGDRLCVDIETGPLQEWPAWLALFDHECGALIPEKPVGYTSYANILALNGRLRLRSRRWWVAAWGPKSPRYFLPGGQIRWAWQYTDGIYGPQPHRYTGVIGPGSIGVCDGSILNRISARKLK